MSSSTVYLLPDGGPLSRKQPWLDHWQAAHGYTRIEQHDWLRPLRGDWSARLQETLVDAQTPAVLVASGLGCILTAWWAMHSRAATKVRAALLIAPVDVEAPQLREQLPGWAPIARQNLPFASIVVGTAECSRAQALAQAWGAKFVVLDDVGDKDGGAAHALLQTLLRD